MSLLISAQSALIPERVLQMTCVGPIATQEMQNAHKLCYEHKAKHIELLNLKY